MKGDFITTQLQYIESAAGIIKAQHHSRAYCAIQMLLIIINGLMGNGLIAVAIFLFAFGMNYATVLKYSKFEGGRFQKVLSYLHTWCLGIFYNEKALSDPIHVNIARFYPLFWVTSFTLNLGLMQLLGYTSWPAVLVVGVAVLTAPILVAMLVWITIAKSVYKCHTKYRTEHIDEAEGFKEYYFIHMYIVAGIAFNLPDMIKKATDESHPENISKEVFA